MTKKLLLLLAVLMGGMTTVMAKIYYVPLYIIDTKPDVSVVKRVPSGPLFITQDDHKLTLPEIEDGAIIMVLKDEECVYSDANKTQVNLPDTLIGDYEVRLCADTYYYYGYITLEDNDKTAIPIETEEMKNIAILNSETPLEMILENLMKLNVVKYSSKVGSDQWETLLTDSMSEQERQEIIDRLEKQEAQLHYGLLKDELKVYFPELLEEDGFMANGVSLSRLFPVLIACIQELKVQLDKRTEKIVDVMMSREVSPSAVRAVRAAIGNTILSAVSTSVAEPARVRFILTDNVSNAYLIVADMGGRVMTKVPVSPSETEATIDSGLLGEGFFLCTLVADGENVGTVRLVKTK
jgi:hypothetical protein